MDIQMKIGEFGLGRDSFAITGESGEIASTVQFVWQSGVVAELHAMASSDRSGVETWVFELVPGMFEILMRSMPQEWRPKIE